MWEGVEMKKEGTGVSEPKKGYKTFPSKEV